MPTSVEVIQGEKIKLDNATVVASKDKQFEVQYGYMQAIALVVLDQGKNVMKDPNLS